MKKMFVSIKRKKICFIPYYHWHLRFIFETGTCYVAQAGLGFVIFSLSFQVLGL